jgi:magnesium transporter
VKTSTKAGLSPGSLIYVGKRNYERSFIEFLKYNCKKIEEKNIKNVEDSFKLKENKSNTWINVVGLSDEEVIEKIGEKYKIHPLVLEDILHTEQRPKIEFFDNYIFIVLKTMSHNKKENKINFEQLSILLGNHFVITFQEKKSNIFDALKKRLNDEKSKLRQMNSDYLAHGILDIVIDNYFLILEKFGNDIELFEDELMIEPLTKTLNEVYQLKRELLFLRKSVFPLKDVVTKLERSESKLIDDKTKFYLKDIYDHVVQVIETVDTQRDLVMGLLELYDSRVSQRMNEVIKVLTIISTIFIPLTFIAGIYGMNFKFMPELSWEWGYYFTLMLMIVAGIGMIIFFKRKKWI